MAHEVLKGAPVSAKAQTEANETGAPCREKYGKPTTKGNFMDFETKREAVGTVGAASAGSFELRMAVRKVLSATRMTQDRMARDAGLSGSALSQWLHGKYQGDVAALEGRMAAWLADTQASALDPCEVAPVWVQTPTATAIERVCNYARTEPSIGLVYGASGVGKTKALKRYAADFDGVWYVRLKPTTSSLVSAPTSPP